MNCFIHQNRPAVRAMNVPCAEGGKLWLCVECDRAPKEEIFKAYQQLQGQRIDNFKTIQKRAMNN
jgi:uncharacterized pyridoxamine 5'-phosphate oxidase family protein